jgi:hypothetical protein
MPEVQNGEHHLFFTRILFLMFPRVTAIADKLGVEFALIHRQRDGKAENAPEKMDILVGDVQGKVTLTRWRVEAFL